MAEDPYTTLGIPRTASEDEVRRAFRTLAKKHHPDLNPGDSAAEARFKAISAANELLSDADKRARFDRGELDAEGQPRPERQFYRGYADAPGRGGYTARPGTPEGHPLSEEELGDIMGAFFRPRAPTGPARGADHSYALEVPLLDAVRGTTTRLALPDGRTLDVTIPPGLEDGQTLRLRGGGAPGRNGGPPGDALIEVAVLPHSHFRREGRDLHLDLPVTVREAVLGARVPVPTPGGTVTLSVPPRSDSGTRLRLRGRGVPASGDTPAGDLFCTLRLVLGGADDRLAALLADWHPAEEPDPRAGLSA